MSKTYYLKIKQDNGIIRRCRLMTSTGLKSLIVSDIVIPSEYQQVEWIGSTGTQYIDTGIYDVDKVNCTWKVTTWSQYEGVYGNYQDENTNCVRLITQNTNNNKIWVTTNYKAGASQGFTVAYTDFNNTVATKTTFTINGTENTFTPTVATTSSTKNICLFGSNSGAGFKGQIKSCMFYKDDVLVRNFVACYRISDDVIGMYDTVTQTFYTNKGSGTFTMGDVVLPSTYQKVDYIQSSGTQWIDTGFTPNQDTSIELSMNVLSATGTQDFFGASTSADGYSYGFYDGGSAVWDNYNDDISPYSGHISGEMVVKKTKNVLTVTGSYPMTYTHSTSTFTSGNTMYLFARNKSSGAFRPASIKFYYCKIWDGDSLVRNFIPCYRKSDNVVGLYDLITDTFFTNSGTGSFTKG